MDRSAMFLGLLLCVCAVSLAVAEDSVVVGGCDDNFTDTTGNFSTPTDPGANKTYTWCIRTNDTSPSVMLQVLALDFSAGNDVLTIYAGDSNTSRVITTFKNTSVSGLAVTVISPAKVTKIVLERGNEKNMTSTFSAIFNTINCSHTISGMQGVITSPIYLNGTGDVTCSYDVDMTGNTDVVLVTMKQFSLPNGTLDVTFNNKTTTLSGEGNQNDLFGPAGSQSFTLTLSLKNDPRPQKFTALFSTVNKDCSGSYTAKDQASTLTLPVTQFPTTCHAQIAADKKKFVYASVGTQTPKSILLYDGGSVAAPQIGDFHTGSWYGSSGQLMTLVANLDGTNAKATTISFKQQADQALYSLALGKNVSLQLKTETGGDKATKAVQFLTVKNGKLSVKFNSKTKLTNNATVILQDGGDGAFGKQIFSFKADTALFSVVSPSNRLIVVVKDVTGDNVVDITVSAVKSGCSYIYTTSFGSVNWGQSLFETQCTLGIINSSSMASTDITTFEVSSLTLCGNSTLSVYQGFQRSAPLLATYTPASVPVLNIRFLASVGAKLVWSDLGKSCFAAEPILKAVYWTQSAASACGGDFSNKMSGLITSPGFPDTYPLNTHCTYPLKDEAKANLYVTLNAMQIDPVHNLTLKKNGNITRYFRNTTGVFNSMMVDAIVPAGNLSLDFDATATSGKTGQRPNAGYSLSFRFLTCGGVVTKTNSTITSPVNVTKSTECIWIIQLEQKGANDSVNVVSANISVTGLSNKSKNAFEVRDGGSARDTLVPLNGTTSFLSRTNYLWIRYYVDVSNKSDSLEAGTPFNFTVKYIQHNCNSTTKCGNGLCMHQDWLCDGVNNCGDWSDESHCNGSRPIPTTPGPTPTPQPHSGGSKGVKAYWIVICLILGLIMGVVLTFVIPAIYRRIKYPNYTHLRDTMAPSEA